MQRIKRLKRALIEAAQTESAISYKDCAVILGLIANGTRWSQGMMPDILEALCIIDYTNNVYLTAWVELSTGDIPAGWNDSQHLDAQQFEEYYRAWRVVSHLYYMRDNLDPAEYAVGNFISCN